MLEQDRLLTHRWRGVPTLAPGAMKSTLFLPTLEPAQIVPSRCKAPTAIRFGVVKVDGTCATRSVFCAP